MIEQRGHDRRICVALVMSFSLFYLFFNHGRFAGTDEVGAFANTRAIWESGSLQVDPGMHVFKGRHGRHYNLYAVGQSVAALPFYGLGKLAKATLPEGWLRAMAGSSNPKVSLGSGTVEIFTTGLYSPFASGLLVGLFFILQRRLGTSLRSALISTVLLGATTYVAMMSVYFLRHTSESLAVLGSLYCYYDWKQTRRRSMLATGSFLLSFTLLVRVAAALAGPVVAIYLAYLFFERTRDRARPSEISWARDVAAVALPLLAVVAVYMWLNYLRWGTLLQSPHSRLLGTHSFETPLARGLAGFLLSPGCSVFLYTPLLLFTPFALREFWRTNRPECAVMLGVAAVYLLVLGQFTLWTGLWSAPGPRYLFLLTPLLLLPFGLWLDATSNNPRRPWIMAAVVLLGVVGGAIQLGLMAAPWGGVIRLGGYQHGWNPELAWVWVWDRSPILWSMEAVRRGMINTWLFLLAQGWRGQAGQPGAAAAILCVWASLFTASIWVLVRVTRPALLAEASRDVSDAERSGNLDRSSGSP
jgi:hypothetical protein